jgi:2',3'-cyclic-nucleotide 2'-phosphodiesterase (5'-nucleotidase family)
VVEGGGWALGSSESQKFQSLFVADMMGNLGYSVVNVAPSDLTYGVDVLRQTALKNKFELVSANLKRKSNGEPVFKPYVVRNLKGIRVGFMGIMSEGESLGPPTSDGEDLTVTEPKEAVMAVLPELRTKADVVVLFSHVSQRKTQQLVDEVKGIDIAVSGGDSFVNFKPTEVGSDSTGKSLVLEAGGQAKYLGALVMVVSEHGKILRYTHNMHQLDKNVKDDSTIVAMVEDFKGKLRDVRKREAVEQVIGQNTQTPTPAQEKFLGAMVCQRCHQAAYEAWNKSTHAHSMKPLEAKAMETSAECLKCHVTGYSIPNGYPNAATELGSVSCEQCHGYGTLHGDKQFTVRPAAESCKTCHDSKNSPNFEYESYWARIAH